MDDDPRRYRCCRRCREEWEADNADLGTIALLARHMSVCPQCGSKRCKKADDHRAVCRPPLVR